MIGQKINRQGAENAKAKKTLNTRLMSALCAAARRFSGPHLGAFMLPGARHGQRLPALA